MEARPGVGQGAGWGAMTCNNSFLVGTRRIFCSRGNDATIRCLGVREGMCIGGVDGGGVGDDGVKGGEVTELVLAKVAGMVAVELRCAARSASAARMASAAVSAGFVKYLCLKKTVLEILVACVFSMTIFQYL